MKDTTLCHGCVRRMVLHAVGKCSACGGYTPTVCDKLCRACAEAREECRACGKAMAGEPKR